MYKRLINRLSRDRDTRSLSHRSGQSFEERKTCKDLLSVYTGPAHRASFKTARCELFGTEYARIRLDALHR